MSRWNLIFIFFVLIQGSINKVRTDKHDITVPEATCQACKGKGKDCILFAQKGFPQTDSSSCLQHCLHSEQPSLSGRCLFALRSCDHVGQASMAVQMVYEAEQSHSTEMRQVRLPVAHLHRLQFRARRTRSTSRRMEIYDLGANGKCKYQKEDQVAQSQEERNASEVQERHRDICNASLGSPL